MLDPDERERRVAELLETWPDGLRGVLVGGYAVAAYGTPRYSVDVDVVVSRASSKDWMAWLTSHRLVSKSAHRISRPQEPRVEFQRWGYRSVTLDLMIGGLRDRDSGVAIQEDWLLREPRSVRLELLSGRLANPVNTVRLEGLWATKLLAGRPHDLTDLFGISGREVNLAEVRELFGGASGRSAQRKFRLVLDRLKDSKTYVDTLSRLMQGSPDSQANRARWLRFTNMVERALPPAVEHRE